MSEWQPIETAPRDGTVLLGFGEAAGEINGPFCKNEVAPICWSGGRSDYPGYEWTLTCGDAYACWMRPTHWMPLPTPPKTEDAIG